jgi:hypothetical protein
MGALSAEREKATDWCSLGERMQAGCAHTQYIE